MDKKALNNLLMGTILVGFLGGGGYFYFQKLNDSVLYPTNEAELAQQNIRDAGYDPEARNFMDGLAKRLATRDNKEPMSAQEWAKLKAYITGPDQETRNMALGLVGRTVGTPHEEDARVLTRSLVKDPNDLLATTALGMLKNMNDPEWKKIAQDAAKTAADGTKLKDQATRLLDSKTGPGRGPASV